LYVLIGVLLYSLVDALPRPNPIWEEAYAVHLTELIIIISLVLSKCPFKNIFTYIAPFQDVLDCGSITFILDLEPDRLPI
jgi:hypothetical protein